MQNIRVRIWNYYRRVSLVGLLFICCILLTISTLIYFNKLLPPNTYINSIAIGLTTPQLAEKKIANNLPTPIGTNLVLTHTKTERQITTGDLQIYPNTQAVISKSLRPDLSGWQRIRWIITSYANTQDHAITYSFPTDKVEELLSQLEPDVGVQSQPPQAFVEKLGNKPQYKIFEGALGLEIDKAATAQKIVELFNKHLVTKDANTDLRIEVVTNETGYVLSEAEIESAKNRANLFIGETLILNHDEVIPSPTMSGEELIQFLNFPDGYNNEKIKSTVASLAANINREAVNPVFKYDKNKLIVFDFQPPKTGLALDQQVTVQNLIASLTEYENKNLETESETLADSESSLSANLEITTTTPQTALAETNDVGIVEQIGFGDSYYDHSIPSRIKNVALAAKRVDNILVASGEEFSFNKTLGEVSRKTGFEPAYIIKNGMTQLGDGGGVCQVSTTLFRSVLDAGLKVTLRLPHSYRVSYYELDRKPGIDATVYAGNVDFRFVNDTPNHILIHSQTDSENLYMSYTIYGTSDGRSTKISEHTVWGASPPLPTQYIVDPTMKPGTRKQIDWAAGGIKAKFTNTIFDASGAILREDTYTSNYKPWAAKFLVGPDTI